MKSPELMLVGAGPMAVEYAKVLQKVGLHFLTIGRGDVSAAQFKAEVGHVEILSGGLEAHPDLSPQSAIVATSVETLCDVGLELLRRGCKKILLEKPGAIEKGQLELLREEALRRRAKVFIGYNRRYFPSTRELKRRLEIEGGVQSGHFEFTEWAHVIDRLPDSIAKRTTFVSNSTHVVDLAFFLLGRPRDFSVYTAGEKAFDWNQGPSRFAGAGVTATGALFSYCANWTSAGRWSVEVMTKESRYILRPMEKLQRQALGSIQLEEIPLQSEPHQLKPGLWNQVNDFIGPNDPAALVSIEEQIQNFEIFKKIQGD